MGLSWGTKATLKWVQKSVPASQPPPSLADSFFLTSTALWRTHSPVRRGEERRGEERRWEGKRGKERSGEEMGGDERGREKRKGEGLATRLH